MAQAWPVSLQQVLNRDSFAISSAETILKSDMETGAPKRRRRFTKGVKDLTCSILVNGAGYSTLDTFYTTTLNGGIDSFEFIHPITSVLTLYKFNGPPKFTPVGFDSYNVSMVWEEQIA